MARKRDKGAPVDLKEVVPVEVSTPRFEVKLRDTRPQIVEAATPEEAWEKFKLANGILGTDHVPEIVEVVDVSSD